jgi:hypothetical protein
MTHKEQLQKALVKELNICKRLFTLLPEGTYDYQPQEGMRTTLRLLRYISFITGTTLEAFNSETVEEGYANYAECEKRAKEMKPEDFPARIDEEIERVNSFMNGINDDELLTREVTQSWGEKDLLGGAIMESALKWITGYKMQLFLYAKMSGAKELDTGDCWFITE